MVGFALPPKGKGWQMKAIITGANGTLGKVLSDYLRQQGIDAEHLHPLPVMQAAPAPPARKPSSSRRRVKDEATMSLFELIKSATS